MIENLFIRATKKSAAKQHFYGVNSFNKRFPGHNCFHLQYFKSWGIIYFA